MKVRNVSDGIRHIADTGDAVEPDAVAVVKKALGESLCEQSDVWEHVTEKSDDQENE